MRVIKVDRCGIFCPYFSNTLTEYGYMTTDNDMICTKFKDQYDADKNISAIEPNGFPEFCKLEEVNE